MKQSYSNGTGTINFRTASSGNQASLPAILHPSDLDQSHLNSKEVQE